MIQENGRWEPSSPLTPAPRKICTALSPALSRLNPNLTATCATSCCTSCRLYVENGLRSINMTGVFHAVAAMHGCTKGCLSSGITGELRCAAEGKIPLYVPSPSTAG